MECGTAQKKLRYSVSEIAAISLDENLHTVHIFRFLLEQSNGYMRSEKHFERGKALVAEQKQGKSFTNGIADMIAWFCGIRRFGR